MNQEEIIRDINSVVTHLGSKHSLKKGETRNNAESRQCAELVELFGLLRIEEKEFQKIVLKCGQRLMKKGFYSALLKYVAPVLKVSLDRSTGSDLGIAASYKYLLHVSGFYVALEHDSVLHNPRTAHQCLEHLRAICEAMITLFPKDEDNYHIIFNGTVHLYGACTELFQRRHYKEVALFLGFAVQSCSATILAQTKYFPWRCRIFLSLALAYDMIGDVGSGELVIGKGLSEVTELFDLEMSDTVSPPLSTIETLQNCALQLQSISLRYALIKKAAVAVLTSDIITSTVSSVVVGLNLSDKDRQSLSPTPSRSAVIELLITAATSDEYQAGGKAAIPSESISVILRHIDGLLSEIISTSDSTESDQKLADITPPDLLVSFISLCYISKDSELLQHWVNHVDQTYSESNIQTIVQQEFDIYKALVQVSSKPDSLVSLRDALRIASENSEFLSGRESFLEETATTCYTLLTQNADSEVIRKLPDDSYLTIEIIVNVWISCNCFDLVRSAQAALLLAKWAAAKQTKNSITRALSVIQRMLILITYRREQFERNTSLSKQSDSLMYATVAVQQSQLISYDVQLQMRLGIYQLYQKQLRSQKKRIEILTKRKEQSHIFGELSAKEREILLHEECSSVEIPSINEETQQRLISERSDSSGHLSITLTVVATFCRQPQQLQILLRAKDQISSQTQDGAYLPLDMQWSLFADAAMKCKCYELVLESVAILKNKYLKQAGIDHPAEEIWSKSPVVADYIVEELVVKLPTPLVEALTKAFTAAVDAMCISEITHWEYKDDPDQSFDVGRFKMSDIQHSRLRSANLLTSALALNYASGNNVSIVDSCTKLFNCLLPLIRTKSKPVCLLRPLWLMAVTLTGLEGIFLNTPAYQFLLVKVFSELFACLLAGNAGENVASEVIKLFHSVWNVIKQNPTDQLLYRRSSRIESRLFTKSGDDAPQEVTKGGKKGAPAPTSQALNMLPDVNPTIEDLMPMEMIELLDFVVFQFPAGASQMIQLHEQEAWLPSIYATVLSTAHSNPSQAFEEVQQLHRSDTMYPKIMANLLPLIMKDKSQLSTCGDLIDVVLKTLSERSAAIRATEETIIAPLDEVLQSISSGGSNTQSSIPVKGGKPAKGKEPAADDLDPEAQRLRKQEMLTKYACITLIKYKRSRTLQGLRIRQATIDVPYRAKLNELRAAVHLNEALSDIKNYKKLLKTHNRSNDEPQEMPEKSWKSETSCMTCLSKSLVLYARLHRWKHVYSAMVSMSNSMAVFFPGEELPTVLPIPNCAKPSDPSLQALAGLQAAVTNGGDSNQVIPYSKGVAMCRTQIRSALEQVVCFTEQLSDNDLDIHSYINSIHPSCTEASLSSGNDSLRDTVLAKTTSLRLALTSDGQSALKAQLAPKKLNLWFTSLVLEPEFTERGGIELEESNAIQQLIRESAPPDVKDLNIEESTSESPADHSTQESPVDVLVTVGFITYTTIESIESLNCLLQLQKKTFRFVTSFPENIYDDATADLIINISGIRELCMSKETPAGLQIGLHTVPRKVSLLLNKLKTSDKAIDDLSKQLVGAKELHAADLIKCDGYVLVHYIHDNREEKIDLQHVAAAGTPGVNVYFRHMLIIPPKRKQGLLSMGRETAAEAQKALLPIPPADGKRRVKVQVSGFPISKTKLADVNMRYVIDFAITCMRALQFSDKLSPHPSAVTYGEKLNRLTQCAFAKDILPVVMSFQSAVGRTMQSNQILITNVFRDIPRAETLILSGEVALESYKSSTLWNEVQAEVQRRREGGGGDRVTTVASTLYSRSSGKKSLLRNSSYREIVSRFNIAYSYLRQKHCTLPAMKIVSQLGQLHKDHNATKEATRSWQDGVDIAFGKINAWQSWRDLTRDDHEGGTLLSRLGTSRILVSIILLYKLASLGLTSKQAAAAEHCLLAARLSAAVLSSCLSNPTREYDYSTEVPADILYDADVFDGPLGVDAKSLVHALAYTADYCQRIGHHLMSLPAAALLEYVSSNLIRNTEYTVLARLLRVRALSEIGNLEQAGVILHQVLSATGLPHQALSEVGIIPKSTDYAPEPSGAAAVDPKKGGKKAGNKGAEAIPEEDPNAQKAIPNSRLLCGQDKTSVEFFAGKLPPAVEAMLGPALVRYVYLTQAQFLMRITKSHPLDALEIVKPVNLTDEETSSRELYRTVITLAEQIAQQLDSSLGQAEHVSERTHRCHAKFILAKAHIARGWYSKADSQLDDLLSYNASSHGIPYDIEECETLVSGISITDVAQWMTTKAEVLMEQRKPKAALEVCHKCEQLCRQHEYVNGERSARLIRSQINLLTGETKEALSILTIPQGDDGTDKDCEDSMLDLLEGIARVAAPTRLREEPNSNSPLTVGGGLLEGMTVEILQVDTNYTLVKMEDGGQGFMPTRDLRPGVEPQSKPSLPVPRRLSVLGEARAADIDGRDIFYPRLLLFAAAAYYEDHLAGKENVDFNKLYNPTDFWDGVLDAAELYKKYLQHVGVDIHLSSTWKGLYNCNVPESREACIACVSAGHEYMRRSEYERAITLYSESCLISQQGCDALPHCTAVALFNYSRARRHVVFPPEVKWGLVEPMLELPAVSHTDSMSLLGNHTEIVETLMKAILSTTKGIHDYDLIKNCLMEMAAIFGSVDCDDHPANTTDQETPSPVIGRGVAVASHLVQLACRVSSMSRMLHEPQSCEQPLTVAACKSPDKIHNFGKDPDTDSLSALLVSKVEECQRRLEASQSLFLRGFQEAGDSPIPSTPLRMSSFLTWHSQAIRSLNSNLVNRKTLELCLMNWVRYLQNQQSELVFSPTSILTGDKLLETEATAGCVLRTTFYSISDEILPPKPIVPGEPIKHVQQLPGTYWFIVVGTTGETSTKDQKEDESAANESRNDGSVPPTPAPGIQVVRLVADQREVRAVYQTTLKLKGIISTIIEREDDIAVIASQSEAAAGGQTGGKTSAKDKKGAAEVVTAAPVKKTPDIELLESEADSLKIEFAERMQDLLETSNQLAGNLSEQSCRPDIRPLYPPLTLRDGRLADAFETCLLMSQLFSITSGISISGTTSSAAKDLIGWVHSLIQFSLSPPSSTT